MQICGPAPVLVLVSGLCPNYQLLACSWLSCPHLMMRGAYAVLSPFGQSHAFEERKVKVGPEDDPLKIGRAVARLKPCQDNAIFDCKVLSRNHAVLYYDDGSFYLKDTKSSNGTFVNNDRLASTGEESEPKQVYSGDILQFGVEIVENSNKVAHGCIFAIVRLFDNEGNEAEPPSLSTTTSTSVKQDNDAYFGYSLIGSHQLFQLQQYLKEALYREKTREEKMRQLEEVLVATEAASETAWKAGVNEDRLLARIESLEAALSIHSKNSTPDKLKQELDRLVEERSQLEMTARENVNRALEEKNESTMRLADVERSMITTEEECNHLRKKVDELEESLASSIDALEKQIILMTSQSKLISEAEGRAEEAEMRLRDRERSITLNERKEELGDDKLRSALVYLATSPPIDRQLLSSLHSVTSQMLKESSEESGEEDETEAIPPVPDAPQGHISDDVQRDSSQIPDVTVLNDVQRQLAEVTREKLALEVELESLRLVRQRNTSVVKGLEMVKMDTIGSDGIGCRGGMGGRELAIVNHWPSMAVVALVPGLGFLLLLFLPLFSRLSIQS
ncbi:hypothetical protein PMAYCL1PPCAC_18322 [Pristionchus mayeri]|uniref:FHA domain-containing protein n=1 Tax=Pristionchus mayeri TaxID=1317129 RepID=A0AAN5CPL1_9BILA|nr:hypothetical protein PMAYCL1PPCAC_18322 [Pristionchus mayeri]